MSPARSRPSLASGPADIRLLCQHLLAGTIRRSGPGRGRRQPGGASRLAPAAQEALCRRHWPGNVSELIRVLEHAARRCRAR